MILYRSRWNQLVDAFRYIDISVPELVIEVPKILCPVRPSRAVLAATLMENQLVAVPLIVSQQPRIVPQSFVVGI